MNVSFQEYIQNPMGRKNAVFSGREMYRNMYREKLDKILVREVGKVKYELYMSNDVKYYVHFKIPSEVVPNFYYDTVLEFHTDNPAYSTGASIKDYYVKFYSNDPSFVYTFAYAMLNNQMFIRDLIPRMSKEAVTKVAKDKNPKSEIGYVKSIYFAYLLMEKYNLFNKSQYNTYAKKYSRRAMLMNIDHATKKIEERKLRGEENAAKKRKAKRKEKNDNVKAIRTRDPGARDTINVKRSKVVSSNSNTKTAKKAKRI